ncbi:MAG: hypothetical protein U0169_05220 [Polyangiaceae bacterium]
MFRSVLSLLAVGVVVAGCSVESSEADADADLDTSTSEDAIRASVTPGTFKLYANAGTTPDAFCDLHDKLELVNAPLGIAKISATLEGLCELAPPHNDRSYNLHAAGTSCGSKIYTGRAKVNGGWNTVRITDHRSRTCRDIQPAKIVVEETTPGFPGRVTTTLFSANVPVAPPSLWLTTSPKQCGTNAWERARPARLNSVLGGEAGQVDTYFKSQNIALDEVAFLQATEPRMVCMACSCPRGDVLLVKAKNAADAAALVANHGFRAAENVYAKGTVQCGGNPWEGGQMNRSEEATNLAAWLTGQGIETTDVGFANKTQSFAVCAACQCSRGDRAIAIAASASEGAELVSQGFAKL